MKQIPMVDLAGQYQKIKPEVDAAIAEILTNTSFINGPAVKQFQQNLEQISRHQACDSLCQWHRCFTSSNDGARFKTW